MRVLLVDPDTTAAMTAAIAAGASAVAPGTVAEAINPDRGPASIQSEEDERHCLPALLDILWTADQRPPECRPDAYLIDGVAAATVLAEALAVIG